VVAAVLDEEIDTVAEITLGITSIIERNNAVDWQNNTVIHNQIAQEIDDLFYEYEKNNGFKGGLLSNFPAT
jgi:type I restriction enzyme R subunit